MLDVVADACCCFAPTVTTSGRHALVLTGGGGGGGAAVASPPNTSLVEVVCGVVNTSLVIVSHPRHLPPLLSFARA